MLSPNFKSLTRLSSFSRSIPSSFGSRAMSSTIQARSSKENSTKSQEPLAQRLNIDDPESSDLRHKTQAAQSKTENLVEPATETSGSAPQPTREPLAQKESKDVPPHDSLRGQTHEAMSRSENTRET